MIAFSRSLLLASTLFLFGFDCGALGQGRSSDAALRQPVSHFEIENQTLFDGLSRLSSEPIPLRLAFEEILRQNESDARDREVRFSVRLENNSVRDILDALCAADARYTWSLDESTINVYPRAVETDPSYLLNLHLAHIELKNITDAYEALTPLARLIPTEQIGYRHLGPSVQYASPWNASFENLTVRQFINRIAAHLGPTGGWVFSGSKENRWFTFHNGSFARLGSKRPVAALSPSP